MKRIFCFLIVAVLSLYMTMFVSADDDYVYKEPDYGYSSPVKYFDSSDGRYSYVIDSEGKAYFRSSHEEDITVLYIPDEIDGHPIVGIYDMYINSPCVTKIVYSSGIKTVCTCGLAPTSYSDSVPLCSIVLNEGLERISKNANSERYSSNLKKTECPFLILPKSLSYIGEYGISARNYKNIVFQSDPVTVQCSVSALGEDWDGECSVYLTDSAKQMDPGCFYYVWRRDLPDFIYYFPDDRVHVYGNGDSYPFPVEKYTENFWESIKETEKVTLDKSEVQLKAGKSAEINASIYPTDAYDGRVFYVSLDEETASVDSEGKITALKDGTATIRAVAASGAYADCTVTVGTPVIQPPEKPINKTVILVSAVAVSAIALTAIMIIVSKKRNKKQ